MQIFLPYFVTAIFAISSAVCPIAAVIGFPHDSHRITSSVGLSGDTLTASVISPKADTFLTLSLILQPPQSSMNGVPYTFAIMPAFVLLRMSGLTSSLK